VPAASSAQEEKEMAEVMGDTAPAEDTATDIDVAAEAAPVEDTDETTTALAEDRPAEVDFKPGVPDGCPGVEVLPDTKSITYFDDKDGRPIGQIVARAQLTDVRGGCDYTKNSVVVDIDMLMTGHISDKGRYEGRQDLEAFMTFPYFVAVMDPSGKMIDKKIMATAMRFQPEIDDLDHAEKITQTIPLSDVGQGSKYTITLGFQLNRQQLDYNRGVVSDAKPVTPVAAKPSESDAAKAPAAKPAPKAKAATKKVEEPVTKVEAPVVIDKPAKLTPAPAPEKSGASKMKPIVD